ncbi:hypothetical protein, partial [Methanosarcina spelaei]|uniref:hypothetical protein n=1 Tax=Methanosarcina spelaei TaxID=1036679 RepID=UPI001BAFBDF3
VLRNFNPAKMRNYSPALTLFRATQFFLFSRKNWIYNELFLSLMKREEILALCTSNPEVIATYIESLESQIKQLRNCLKIKLRAATPP